MSERLNNELLNEKYTGGRLERFVSRQQKLVYEDLASISKDVWTCLYFKIDNKRGEPSVVRYSCIGAVTSWQAAAG